MRYHPDPEFPRTLPATFHLAAGEVWLHGIHLYSWDSRHYGPVAAGPEIAVARPIVTRALPELAFAQPIISDPLALTSLGSALALAVSQPMVPRTSPTPSLAQPLAPFTAPARTPLPLTSSRPAHR